MQRLWRTTCALFWEYPGLWMPVACADLAAFFARHFERPILQAVMFHLMGRHSVLGPHQAPVPGTSNMSSAAVAGALTGLGIEALIVAAYVAALFLTVKHLSRQMVPEVSAVKDDEGRRILRVGLRSVALSLVVFMAAILVIPVLLHVTRGVTWLRPQYVAETIAALIMVGLAWWLTPSVLRSLAELYGGKVNTRIEALGKKTAAAAVLASSALSTVALEVRHSQHDTGSHWMLSLALSLIVVAPYILAFIAFGVLTLQPAHNGALRSASDDEFWLLDEEAASP